MLKEADNYHITVSAILDEERTEIKDENRKLIIVPVFKEGLALVEFRILRDYGQEIGSKTIEVIVDLLKEKVKK
jgi:hypothetical protein